jgi:CheY-like chemotaxis protein
VRFEVHDTGPGIDDQTQARLFRPFTQADESTTRRYGGTGLGLSICRELATLMGGEVGVQSRFGEGSCFWAELPLPATAVPAAALEADAPAQGSLRGASVLMVEDNPVNMLIAAALLERWGVHIEQASDGQQAVQAVQRRAQNGALFDAVLMDVQMPVMSGYEATRMLRRDYSAERLPIIALTAAALVSEREQALAAGMNDFLTKPIDEKRLQQALLRWIGVRRGQAAQKL